MRRGLQCKLTARTKKWVRVYAAAAADVCVCVCRPRVCV